MVYRDHVNLEFVMGTRLKSKLLTGTGKGLRHVKIMDPSDIDQKGLSRLLTEASLLAKKAYSSSTRRSALDQANHFEHVSVAAGEIIWDEA